MSRGDNRALWLPTFLLLLYFPPNPFIAHQLAPSACHYRRLSHDCRHLHSCQPAQSACYYLRLSHDYGHVLSCQPTQSACHYRRLSYDYRHIHCVNQPKALVITEDYPMIIATYIHANQPKALVTTEGYPMIITIKIRVNAMAERLWGRK